MRAPLAEWLPIRTQRAVAPPVTPAHTSAAMASQPVGLMHAGRTACSAEALAQGTVAAVASRLPTRPPRAAVSQERRALSAVTQDTAPRARMYVDLAGHFREAAAVRAAALRTRRAPIQAPAARAMLATVGQ